MFPRPLAALTSLVLIVAAGCAPKRAPRTMVAPAPTPASPRGGPAEPAATTEPVPAVASPVLTYDEARAQATTWIARIGVKGSYDWDEANVARAKAAGLDLAHTMDLLEALVSRPAPGPAEREDPAVAAAAEELEIVFAYVPHVISRAALPRLYALRAQRAWAADEAVERGLEHLAARSLAVCAPPSSDELAAARSTLDSFVIVESTGASRSARAPSVAELDDLAYLHAALAGSGAPVGEDQPASSPLAAPPANAALDRVRATLEAAEHRGDARGVQRAARAYLGLLGYPGRLRGDEESNMTWGGPGYGHVMRTLAHVDELLGDFEEAMALYRRAPPGGGACGTSVAYRLEDQRKGLIRAAEGAGQCRASVRERLYAPEGRGFEYGPARLRAAGWDVPRLYRAALLTVDRDAPIAELEISFDALAVPLRQAARERLRARGPEALAVTLRAAAGLADEQGAGALTRLHELARSPSTAARLQGIEAMAALADLPISDPCRPLSRVWHSVIDSGEAPRAVSPRNHECGTKLSKPDQAGVITAVRGAANDPAAEVRIAAAKGIVRVAPAGQARPVLERLTRDTYEQPGWSRTDAKGVEQPVRPVADAARSGIERLEARKRR